MLNNLSKTGKLIFIFTIIFGIALSCTTRKQQAVFTCGLHRWKIEDGESIAKLSGTQFYIDGNDYILYDYSADKLGTTLPEYWIQSF